MGFKLEQEAIVPVTIQKKESQFTNILQKEIHLFDSGFSAKKKEQFYMELAVLLKAGITLKEGLSLILENQKKAKEKVFYKTMVDTLVSGKSFSDIIAEKKVFSNYEYHAIKIGEESGTLAQIVTELGHFFARKNEQRRLLINALTYPVIILSTAILVVIFMLRMVVPMFQDIFTQNKVELPFITRIIIIASDFIGAYGLYMMLLITGVLALQKTYRKKMWFVKNKDLLLLKTPYLGKFIKAVYLAQFTQALSLLTRSKVPLLNSIRLVQQMIEFYPLKTALIAIEKEVLQGKSLSQGLKTKKIFDNRMISLVKVAEETNQTEFIFDRLNEQYTIEVQQKSKMLSTLLEPLIIVIVGVLVGVILVAMYLPMFKLSSILG